MTRRLNPSGISAYAWLNALGSARWLGPDDTDSPPWRLERRGLAPAKFGLPFATYWGRVSEELSQLPAALVGHSSRTARLSAAAALSGFERFPAWMWRNTSVLDFVEWLRERNDAAGANKAGFYGLDLYSLFTSIQEVVRYLEEVDPVAASRHAAVVATGRSDYANQINNVLAFPGFFRGLLDAGARDITDPMMIAAATAIADTVHPDELNASYIVPSVFDADVAPAVAAAVRQAAGEQGAHSDRAEEEGR